MTLNDFQRVMLAEFAIRQAGPLGSVEQMKAICYVMRNRVRKGWNDGNWIATIEAAPDHAAHDPLPMRIDPSSRTMQRLISDIDDIFYSYKFGATSDDGSILGNLESTLTEEKHEALYWSYANRPVREWFLKKIQKDGINHPLRAQMGTMMFYE